MATILAIDDEADILTLIQNTLKADGHKVDSLEKADDMDINKIHRYDLILLDIMMPGTDGLTFCQAIRQRVSCPILFLTAKSQEEDLLMGLASGGDDYIKKPFSIDELKARVRAHLRREQRERHAFLDTSGIRFDLSAQTASIGQAVLAFTKSEYQICVFLAKHKGQVFSREQIYEAVFGYDGQSDASTISEHVKNIRAKLVDFDLTPIKTVWGIGYQWI